MRKILFFSIFSAFLSILFWTGEASICVGAGSEDLNLTISSAKCELQPVSPAPYYEVSFNVQVHAKGGITSYSATPFHSLPACDCTGSDPDWNCRCKGNLNGEEYTGNNFLSVSIYNEQGQQAVAVSEFACSNMSAPSPSPDNSGGAPSVRITSAKCVNAGVGPGQRYEINFDAEIYAEGGISDYNITGFPLSKTPACYYTSGDAPNFKYHCSAVYTAEETESIQGKGHDIVINIYDGQNRKASDFEEANCPALGDNSQPPIVSDGDNVKITIHMDDGTTLKVLNDTVDIGDCGDRYKVVDESGEIYTYYGEWDEKTTSLSDDIYIGCLVPSCDERSAVLNEDGRVLGNYAGAEGDTKIGTWEYGDNGDNSNNNGSDDSPTQDDGRYIPLYNYGQDRAYCSKIPCSGESGCEAEHYPCANTDYPYDHKWSLTGFKNLYDFNNPKLLCRIDYDKWQDCPTTSDYSDKDAGLAFILTALDRPLAARPQMADISAFPDKFRIFIPPGTLYAGAGAYFPNNVEEGLIARYKQLPDGEYLKYARQPSHSGDVPWDWTTFMTLDAQSERDFYLRNSDGFVHIVNPFAVYTPFTIEDSGWLYIQKLPFTSDTIHDIQVQIRVNLDAYLEWYNKVKPCTDSNHDPSAGYCWDANGNPVELSSTGLPEVSGNFRPCDESLDWEQCVEPDYKFFQFSSGTCDDRASGDISYQDNWCQSESYGNYSCCSDSYKTFGCYSFLSQGTPCGTDKMCDGNGHCVSQNASSDITPPTVTAEGSLQENGNIQVSIHAYDNEDNNPVIYYSAAHNGIDPGEPNKKGTDSVGIGSSSAHTSIVVRYYAIDASGNKSQVYDFTYNKPGDTNCLSDFNGDSKVNIQDLAILARDWGKSGDSDLNNDGTTDIKDLRILMENWGNDCK